MMFSEPACQRCGTTAGQPDPYCPGRVVLLEVRDECLEPDGFRFTHTVCSTCLEGAAGLEARPTADLAALIAVRRADVQEQMEIYQWLRTRFSDW